MAFFSLILLLVIYDQLHSLGLEGDFLHKNYLQTSSSFIRLNHYPPCPEEQLPNVLGVGPHAGM